MLPLAGVVILYYPDEQVIGRINSYRPYLDKLYIVDNSEFSTTAVASLTSDSKILYIHDGINKGIAARLNEAAGMAIQAGFSWLLTMDQDSYFDNATLPVYLNCVSDFYDTSLVAMFGVEYENQLSASTTCNTVEVRHLITSGSILNLDAFKNIGKFDEALFIDKVDHEYCLRAQTFHYKIIQFTNIFLHHHLGNITYGRSFKNLKRTPRVLHAPIRMYYITRNYFYLKAKYKNQFHESFAEMKKELWIRFKNNLLYGKKKTQLLKYVMRGFRDYKLNNMGKFGSRD